MVFSSHLFLFYFLPLALAAYYLLPRGARHLSLTALSYVFYGWANPAFVPLMLVSTLIDYGAGLGIAGRLGRERWKPVELLPEGGPRSSGQKALLLASLVSNLALLGFFKYFNFGLESWNGLVRALGLPEAAWDTALRVALPLGISFYTFQSMSYTIDVYRGHARAMKSFLDFAFYVSMFPQLVAGPIIRFSDVADQIASRSHTLDKFARGVAFFAMGMGKKILLANPCGQVADAAFQAGALGAVDAWYGLASYGFQIYFDFSAYSDMAVGLGLMLGFNFAKNFDSPYRADSITNFWQRWHLSLSTWLRDYLYIPLGGNRRGPWRTYVNLMLVMLLGGLWHGASWNFVIWGGIHGAMLAGERMIGKSPLYQGLPRLFRVALTFAVVLIAWVFFRAPDLSTSLAYVAALFGAGEPAPGSALLAATFYDPFHLLTFAACAVVVWGCRSSWEHARRIGAPKALAFLALLAWSVGVMWTQSYNPFIYFFF